MDKLQTLADFVGYKSVSEMLAAVPYEDHVPGICMNGCCDYAIMVHHDCKDGYCEVCGTRTVVSCLQVPRLSN